MSDEKFFRLKTGQEYRRGEFVSQKKAKAFYSIKGHPEYLIMRYLDVATSDHDGNIKEEIPGKGVLCAKISDILFGLLGHRYIDEHSYIPIRTHYIGMSVDDPAECLVRRVANPIPLEVLVRNWAYGSYVTRYGIPEGTLLASPICEFTRKDDQRHDPPITEQEILAEGIATDLEVDHMRETALAANRIMKDFFREVNIDLADFKLVFGRLTNVVGDYTNLRLIGELSPDICRLRDVKTGRCFDKDLFRQELPGLSEAYDTVLQRLAEHQKEKDWQRFSQLTHRETISTN